MDSRLILLIILFLPGLCFGQNFAHLINATPSIDEQASKLVVDGDNFYCISSSAYANYNILCRFDNQGTLSWSKFLNEGRIRSGFIVIGDTLQYLSQDFYDEPDSVETTSVYLDKSNGQLISTQLDESVRYFAKSFQRQNQYVITSCSIKFPGSLYSAYPTYTSQVWDDELNWDRTFVGGSQQGYTHAYANNGDDMLFTLHGDGLNTGYFGIDRYDLKTDSINQIFSVNFCTGYQPLKMINLDGNLIIVSWAESNASKTTLITLLDYDGQTIWEHYEPFDEVIQTTHVTPCMNDDFLVVSTNQYSSTPTNEDYLSRFDKNGNLLWKRKIKCSYNGQIGILRIGQVEEASDGRIIGLGSFSTSTSEEDDSVIFSLGSDGCFSEESCETIIFEELDLCTNSNLVGQFFPTNLTVQCDNDGDYLAEINNWIENGGNTGFISQCEEVAIVNDWNEEVTIGTTEITFSIDVPSIEYSETKVVELMIESNNDSPKITSPSQNLSVSDANPDKVSIIQSWLDSGGGMEVYHNCEGFEIDNDFNSNLQPGVYDVDFVVTGENNKKGYSSAMISIEPCLGQWTSPASDLIVQCDQDDNYKNQVDQWIENQAGLILSSECDSISYTNDWNESYETGNYWVIFTASGIISSLEYSRGGFMSIQRGDAPPVLTQEAEDIVILSDDPNLEGVVQSWIAQQGGAEVNDNCGTYSWSNDYTGELFPNDYTVTFVATSDLGVTIQTTATMTIELVSSVGEEDTNDSVILTPNPVDYEITVSGLKSAFMWNIYSIVGDQIDSGNHNSNTLKIDVEQLPQGIYHLELIDLAQEHRIVKRFVKL